MKCFISSLTTVLLFKAEGVDLQASKSHNATGADGEKIAVLRKGFTK